MKRSSVATSAVIGLVLVAIAPGHASWGQPGSLTLASVRADGVKGSGGSRYPSIASDGLTVAFESSAKNLDPNDRDTYADIYVKQLGTGMLTLASTSSAGVKGNSFSTGASLSADGSNVAFWSSASNLHPLDHDSVDDIFVKDLATGDLALGSISENGVKGNAASEHPSLSADGAKVAFDSYADNIDPLDMDVTPDVYVKDLETSELSVASLSGTGVKGNNASIDPSISADGTKVAFESAATNLDPGDSDGFYDVYVKDLITGDLTLASTSDLGVKAHADSFGASLSADGTEVAFYSYARLDPLDTDTRADVYVKYLATGDIVLASASGGGVKGNGESLSPGLSDDGTRVAFYSQATNLDPADADTVPDVYVKELVTGDIFLASITEVGVKGNNGSKYPVVSGHGSVVAFVTAATNFDPRDQDRVPDIYVKELS